MSLTNLIIGIISFIIGIMVTLLYKNKQYNKLKKLYNNNLLILNVLIKKHQETVEDLEFAESILSGDIENI
jgi:TM2 domain-containing membrane protein YozV